MNDKSKCIALGKPIVQYNHTEGRFPASGASLYAQHNDTRGVAMKELLDDEPFSCRMGEIGRLRVPGISPGY